MTKRDGREHGLRRVGAWITMGVAVVVSLAPACGDDLPCEATRTCGGDGRKDGAPDESGGRDGSGGATGGTASDSGGTASVDSGGTAGDASASGGGPTSSGGATTKDASTSEPADGAVSEAGMEAGVPLAITATALASPTLNKPYGFSITTSGGSGAVTFRVSGGALPAGLLLAQDGRISGTATRWGDFDVTIEAKSGEEVVTRAFKLRVVSRLWLAFGGSVVNIGAGAPYVPVAVDANSIKWSPDGNYLLLSNASGSSHRVVDMTGTELKQPVPLNAPNCGTTRWAPNSSAVAFLCADTVQLSSPTRPGDTPRTASLSGWRAEALIWSPDSKWILVPARSSSSSPERGIYTLVNAQTMATTVVDIPNFTTEQVFWTPSSEAIVTYGRLLTEQHHHYFVAKLPTATTPNSLLSPLTTWHDNSGNAVVPPLFNGDGKVVISAGAYTSPAYRQFITTFIGGDNPGSAAIGQRFGAGTGLLSPDEISPQLLNGDAHLVYFTGKPTSSSYLLLQLALATGTETKFWVLSSRQFATNWMRKDLLLPELKTVSLPGGATEQRGALVHYKFGASGAVESETLNTPTKATRQSEFGLSPDSKAAFFIETETDTVASKVHYVDLRSAVHRTFPVGNGPYLNSTAFSPSSTHLATMVGVPSSKATLQVFDLRASNPSAAITLSTSVTIGDLSWQPTWN